MTTQHTPGPWTADRHSGLWAGDKFLADIAFNHIPFNVRHANTHLITAAPDLHRELESSTDFLAQVCKAVLPDTDGLYQEIQGQIVRNLAAIAKSGCSDCMSSQGRKDG